MNQVILFDHLSRPVNGSIVTRRPPEGEIASLESAWGILLDFFLWGRIVANPDAIIREQSKGRQLLIYADMEDRDAHIGAQLQTRKLAVLGLDQEIIPGGDAPEDKEMADFIRRIFEHQIENFDHVLWDLLDSIAKGYAISEIIWHVDEGYVIPYQIKARRPDRFVFDLDDNLRVLSNTSPLEGDIVPEQKFLVAAFQPRYNDRYGVSILRKAFWPYWFKKNGLKFWLTFADKFGAPTLIGKYPPGATELYRQQLLEALDKFVHQSAVIVPEGAEVNLLEAQRTGSVNVYETLVKFCNDEISKAILGQTLTSGEGQRSGSLALGRVHEDVRQDILEADAKAMSAVINTQLIPWIIELNFGHKNCFPRLLIKAEPPDDLRVEAERDKIIVAEIGLPTARSYFYAKYGIPEPTEIEVAEDKILGRTSQPGLGSGFEFAETEEQRDERLVRALADNDTLFAQAKAQALEAYGQLTAGVMALAGKKKVLKQSKQVLTR